LFHEGAIKDLHTELADKYRELAPKIEKYKDSYLAGQLYDALEAIAIEHGAELELKRMMTGARNRAHMDYDTNPGGFQNWFWYLPFADDEQLDEIDRRGFLKGLGATAGLAAMGGAKAADEREAAVWDPSWTKPGQPFDTSITSNSNVTQTGNQRPKLGDRIGSVKGPNAKGEYLVTVINNGEIVSNYVTKTPPASWMHGKHKSYPQVSETQAVAEESQDDRNARIIAGEIEDAMSQGNEQLVKQKIKELISVGYTLNKDGQLQRMGMYEESQLQEKQDACYRKVKSRYKVWPSAYASGALVQCRKKGAANWGNKSKK
jgi:hypothetical protein